jgi:hypothetical protein
MVLQGVVPSPKVQAVPGIGLPAICIASKAFWIESTSALRFASLAALIPLLIMV